MEVLTVHRKYTEKITAAQPTEKYRHVQNTEIHTGAETQKIQKYKGGRDTENIEIQRGQRYRKYRNTKGTETQKI